MQKQSVMLFALLCFVTQLFAQGPNNSGTYYQTADGKKGKSLRSAKLVRIFQEQKFDPLLPGDPMFGLAVGVCLSGYWGLSGS